ncbi:flagellar biosynthesis protein FlhB [Ethanoligenens harbinense]|uniref:Flagellar biosynthetic protein FlhB n=1 Tax=Ethanoligenens harbinense (strain DSM 18485 / JCM 12961 / CGMCC 1.5033 / YUAN-3) TaxID=663278 RepID=E6U6I3_ETHHY|nr:flagellar biosynthesis protein FlhB [Ethanoligenens harbinense]ADU28053.1 flagellar biosynthetic protein FlhB [Ethanoligenens harbinense YUAN-3]AVQ97069.1 flagellar biosynthesis protein FlhB [Ethanoligenens harbinense YUAN-3]AYF39731.1 flagellar biosynthesis protein FlhB [Ethanoligenens harbinense]AYF42564.1 flagellar biosynthesis protein FlhB [Ethanoligenens harbinense]QCN93312.1 flagellar biosynthesis protein FlhB [Ethanoligenens harbinense]
MPEASAGDKTEKATPKRREDERKKGHVVQSPDVTSAVAMLGTFAVLRVMGPSMIKSLSDGMRGMLANLTSAVSGYEDMRARMTAALSVLIGVAVPVMLVAFAATVATTLAQTRLLVSLDQLKPDLSRLNPLEGIKRLFSVRSLVELGKSILKVVLVGAVVYFEIQPQMHTILLLYNMSLAQSFSWVAGILADIGIKVAGVMLLLGAIDYFYQWFQYEKDIRMTKEEIKEEYKQMEGNPEIKGKIKNLQRQMARRRMMQDVPKADVVLRNPTHFAVALKYEHGKQRAPVCVAKGRNAVALRIVEIAEENHVYIREDPPLTRALYQAVEVGGQIPAEFYKAVAEVLAYIYKLRRAGRR